MLISSFAAVLESRSTTPHSRNRFPSISIPTSGVADGRRKTQIRSTMSGNATFSIRLTGRSCFMVILRSSAVVRRRMIGGWMIGTSAM